MQTKCALSCSTEWRGVSSRAKTFPPMRPASRSPQYDPGMISSGATSCNCRPYRSRSSSRLIRSMALTSSIVAAPLFQARQPAHGDGDQVARHLLPNNVGFVLLGQQRIFLEAVVFRQAQGLRREQLLVGAHHREDDG